MMSTKNKIITFSYDDGVTQDIRLIELFKKYNIGATFNINSSLLGKSGALIRNGTHVNHTKVKEDEVKDIYAGFEVASHTLTHPFLPLMLKNGIIHEVEEDRKYLSNLVGYDVVGFAYPGGGKNYNEHVSKIIKENTNIKYARTTEVTYNFDVQSNLYEFKPSVYHIEYDKMVELGKQFINLNTDSLKIFYIWGHSYEFDAWNFWDKFEEFLKFISNRDDILYLSNKEAFKIGEQR